jgi:two-component system, OmpR family, copper resistance phosphate regulon response regulator CusR
MRILLVEDDRKVARFIQQGLEEEGHAVDVAGDGEEGALRAHVDPYDVLILDVQLPRKNGLQLAAELRREGVATPILMLTARDSTEDVVRGLDAGADDYLTKPFAFDELVARVRALGRRSGTPAAGGTLHFADVELDRGRFHATRGGRDLGLTPREFRLLAYLLERPEQVVGRTELLEKVWDLSFDPGSNVVDVHISNLRRKLEQGGAPRLLHTVRGVGFALRAAG